MYNVVKTKSDYPNVQHEARTVATKPGIPKQGVPLKSPRKGSVLKTPGQPKVPETSSSSPQLHTSPNHGHGHNHESPPNVGVIMNLSNPHEQHAHQHHEHREYMSDGRVHAVHDRAHNQKYHDVASMHISMPNAHARSVDPYRTQVPTYHHDLFQGNMSIHQPTVGGIYDMYGQQQPQSAFPAFTYNPLDPTGSFTSPVLPGMMPQTMGTMPQFSAMPLPSPQTVGIGMYGMIPQSEQASDTFPQLETPQKGKEQIHEKHVPTLLERVLGERHDDAKRENGTAGRERVLAPVLNDLPQSATKSVVEVERKQEWDREIEKEREQERKYRDREHASALERDAERKRDVEREKERDRERHKEQEEDRENARKLAHVTEEARREARDAHERNKSLMSDFKDLREDLKTMREKYENIIKFDSSIHISIEEHKEALKAKVEEHDKYLESKMEERTRKFEIELKTQKDDIQRAHRDAIEDHTKMLTQSDEQMMKFKTTLTHLDDECSRLETALAETKKALEKERSIREKLEEDIMEEQHSFIKEREAFEEGLEKANTNSAAKEAENASIIESFNLMEEREKSTKEKAIAAVLKLKALQAEKEEHEKTAAEEKTANEVCSSG